MSRPNIGSVHCHSINGNQGTADRTFTLPTSLPAEYASGDSGTAEWDRESNLATRMSGDVSKS
jgi:hypothetical protein